MALAVKMATVGWLVFTVSTCVLAEVPGASYESGGGVVGVGDGQCVFQSHRPLT